MALSLARAWTAAYAHAHILLRYCLERDTLARSIKTSLLVGTILALLNHGQQMLSGRLAWDWLLPLLLTYLVPFSVATYGQVRGKQQRDRAHADSATDPS